MKPMREWSFTEWAAVYVFGLMVGHFLMVLGLFLVDLYFWLFA